MLRWWRQVFSMTHMNFFCYVYLRSQSESGVRQHSSLIECFLQLLRCKAFDNPSCALVLEHTRLIGQSISVLSTWFGNGFFQCHIDDASKHKWSVFLKFTGSQPDIICDDSLYLFWCQSCCVSDSYKSSILGQWLHFLPIWHNFLRLFDAFINSPIIKDFSSGTPVLLSTSHTSDLAYMLDI